MTAIHAPFGGVATEASHATRMGMVEGQVRTWLRLEGLAAFGVGLVLFWISGGNWLSFVPLLLLPAAVLIAHVGVDRAFGYGLRSPHSFTDTHLGHVGKDAA